MLNTTKHTKCDRYDTFFVIVEFVSTIPFSLLDVKKNIKINVFIRYYIYSFINTYNICIIYIYICG